MITWRERLAALAEENEALGGVAACAPGCRLHLEVTLETLYVIDDFYLSRLFKGRWTARWPSTAPQTRT